MAKAVLCPVCNGSGKQYEPPPQESSAATGNFFDCHGCGGKGWVEVSESDYNPTRELNWHYTIGPISAVSAP